MSDVTGARGTLNVTQAQRKVDMKEKILLLEPESQPLTIFTNKAEKRKCINPEYSWIEDELRARFDAINDTTNLTSSDTTVTVDNGDRFAADDLVRVTRTGEIIRITSVSNDDITFVRSVGATAAAALLDDDELLIIGSAQPENDTANDARSDNPTQVTNYTQIFRDSWNLSNTQRSSDQFTTPHDWNHQAAKTGIEHAKNKEYSFVFGEKSETNSSGMGLRTTGGVYEFIDTNVTDAGGTLSEAEFWEFLTPVFRYGRKEKMGFASQRVVNVLNAFPRNKVQFNQEASKYGVKVFQYISPHGTLNIATHYLLEGEYAGDMFVLDMECCAYRYLAGGVGGSRDTSINTNVQAPDVDGRKDEYLTEAGLEFGEEKRHGLLTGVTG